MTRGARRWSIRRVGIARADRLAGEGIHFGRSSVLSSSSSSCVMSTSCHLYLHDGGRLRFSSVALSTRGGADDLAFVAAVAGPVCQSIVRSADVDRAERSGARGAAWRLAGGGAAAEVVQQRHLTASLNWCFGTGTRDIPAPA